MTAQTQLTAKVLFNKDEVKAKFQELLGKRAPSFITSVLQIVASSNLLAQADPNSVYHSAAVAATLDLPLNNNLGFAYIVPYNQSYKDEAGKWQKRQVAQFQMGYKGFIQLAQRSGQFRTINATDVREGEIKTYNRLTGEITFQWIEDERVRKSKPVVGFVSYFKLLNGFEKSLYMTVEKITEHGVKYSKSYEKENGLWKTDPDSMAIKTVTKLLLSKFAPLSIDLQTAVIVDQALINNEEATDITYIDNEPELIGTDKTRERVALLIKDAKTVEELQNISKHVDQDLLDLFTVKMDELKARK